MWFQAFDCLNPIEPWPWYEICLLYCILLCHNLYTLLAAHCSIPGCVCHTNRGLTKAEVAWKRLSMLSLISAYFNICHFLKCCVVVLHFRLEISQIQLCSFLANGNDIETEAMIWVTDKMSLVSFNRGFFKMDTNLAFRRRGLQRVRRPQGPHSQLNSANGLPTVSNKNNGLGMMRW